MPNAQFTDELLSLLYNRHSPCSVCQVLHSFIHFTHLKQCARLFSRPGEDCALWEHGLPEG